RPSRVAAGIFSKAALSGAKTVKGPGPCRRSARPAAWIALTRVVRFGALEALATRLSDGFIAAPPAIGSVAAEVMGGGATSTGAGRCLASFWPQAASASRAKLETAASAAVRWVIMASLLR